ncbi:MAG: putative adenine-specific methylase, partial [Bacteroidota bacterium]
MAKVNQHTLNKEIEELIRKKDLGNEKYSVKDIAFIQHYEGSGGQGKKGASGEGILYEFYTPDF